MKRICLCAALSVCLVFARSARGDELDDVTSALRRSAEALDGKLPEQINATLRLVAELAGAAAQGGLHRVQALALQVALQPGAPAELKSAAEQLSRELPRLLDARADAFVSATETLIDRTRKECLAAEAESELLPLLRDLSALQQRQPPRAEAPDVARTLRKLDAAIKTTEGWMDELVSKDRGKRTVGIGILHRLKTDDGSYPIVSLAECQRRLAELRPNAGAALDYSAMFAKIKTLKDVESVGADFDSADVGMRPFTALEMPERWFVEFRSAVASYVNGNFEGAWLHANAVLNVNTGSAFAEARRLRIMLLDEVVPKALKLPAGVGRRPDETPADFVRRLLMEAARHGRWDEVQRIATKVASSDHDLREMSDLALAAGAFVEGQRLEAAGDFPAAILAYEKILRITAELAPVREAVERLKALRQTELKAFAEAHPRLESDRVAQLFEPLDRAVKSFAGRLATLEREQTALRGMRAPPAAAVPSESRDLSKLETRLQALEASAAAKTKPDDARLDRLEMLLGPGAEALARRAPERHKFRIWLGADYTVYRSALPRNLEAGLAWIVRHNGSTVLGRNATGEFFFRYPDFKPGTYSVSLTTGASDTPESNILEFTITDEVAAKLPKIIDHDIDRDGVPNK